MSVNASHPYYPLDLELPTYVPNTHSMEFILLVFFAGLVATIYFANNILVPHQSLSRRLTFIWILVSGIIHTTIEAYYVVNVYDLPSQTNYFADLHKEYSKSDSRYLTQNSFVWAVEFLTAFVVGPLCLLACYFAYRDNPIYKLLYTVISVSHIYGTITYYITALFNGDIYCTPLPLYRYFYFAFMNTNWIVIPLIVLYGCGRDIYRGLVLLKDSTFEYKRK
ncbi:Emopamil-binding protein [Globomyces pollinis-pini]|nr:Emopamil-binding protein [Globomyces pollinis-pini]